jgi:antitoxin (DNA-binding transcriptional repressor) of toxin-antitoxin stability system
MKRVGLRELKNRLSEYVRYVRKGHTLLVTDRGEVVAELRPPGSPGSSDVPPGLLELARRGSLTLGGPNHPGLYLPQPRVLAPGELQRLLDEERADR